MGTMPADGKMAQRIGRAKPTWMAHWPYLSGVIMRGGGARRSRAVHNHRSCKGRGVEQRSLCTSGRIQTRRRAGALTA